MLSWEYPPHISGGLGTACEGLSTELGRKGHAVDLLLPKVLEDHKAKRNVSLLSASDINVDEPLWTEEVEITKTLKKLHFGTNLLPYLPAEHFIEEYEETVTEKKTVVKGERKAVEGINLTGKYGSNTFGEIHKYALIAAQQALNNHYDIVHAHDWVTFKAAELIQNLTKTPVFFHSHSIEFDRNGVHGNPVVTEIEKSAISKARYVLAVSHRLKKTIATHYSRKEEDLEVVPNGLTSSVSQAKTPATKRRLGFVGRLTHQKGPSHFLDIAQDLRSKFPNLEYRIVGDGYLMPELRKKVDHINLAQKVSFSGFIPPNRVKAEMRKMDLLIAPSQSEPFGLVILEALFHGIPVITTPETGIAEFIPSLPQIPSWDTFQYSQLIAKLLGDEKERLALLEKCQAEASSLTWSNSGNLIEDLYFKVLDHQRL